MKVERREKESGRRGEEKVIAVHGVVYAGGQSHHGDDDGKKGGERERERNQGDAARATSGRRWRKPGSEERRKMRDGGER